VRIAGERLRWAAEFILARQNPNGGFSTYERQRGGSWLESLNPSEMYRDCMVDPPYVECTASCLRALALYRQSAAADLRPRLDEAIERGVEFLRGCQRPDGSYLGSWGICFTYGIFFAVEGLRATGVPSNDPALARAAAWLVAHQRSDGGWGEHYTSSLRNEYVEHSESQVVMTSWALLALLEIHGPEHPAVERGLSWLQSRQQPDGSWPHQSVNGVFFGSAMLDYRLYPSYFPAWALARARRLRPDGRSA
jgi:lanosterol synthase